MLKNKVSVVLAYAKAVSASLVPDAIRRVLIVTPAKNTPSKVKTTPVATTLAIFDTIASLSDCALTLKGQLNPRHLPTQQSAMYFGLEVDALCLNGGSSF